MRAWVGINKEKEGEREREREGDREGGEEQSDVLLNPKTS